MTSKTDSDGTTDYTYDGLNRLTTVDAPDGTVTAYTYDNNNITEKDETLGTVTTRTAYTYDVSSRLTATEVSARDTSQSTSFVTQETVAYTYDHCGNQTEADTTPYVDGVAGTPYISGAYTYDLWNEMTEATGKRTTSRRLRLEHLPAR